MDDYDIRKAMFLKEMCDDTGKSAIDEIIELYKAYEISVLEFHKAIQGAFYCSVSRDFEKKYAEQTKRF